MAVGKPPRDSPGTWSLAYARNKDLTLNEVLRAALFRQITGFYATPGFMADNVIALFEFEQVRTGQAYQWKNTTSWFRLKKSRKLILISTAIVLQIDSQQSAQRLCPCT